MTLLREGPVLQQLLIKAVRDNNVMPLTGSCNLSCLFCSHRHNPPGTEAFSFNPLSETLWKDLIQYLDPLQKIIIGESATRLREGEPLTHPHFFAIIERLRRLYPETVIQVTTNASLLDRETIRKLALLKPLEIILSLNSVSASGRLFLMNDPEPQLSAMAPGLLGDYRIPFHGSLVALPHLVGFEDLKLTIATLDRAGAETIRILLPGYTALSDLRLIPPAGIENQVYSFITKIKAETTSALLAEPPLITDLASIVEGVIRDSPAGKAGITAGDRVVSVDGQKTRTRVEAFRLIERKAGPVVRVERSGEQFDLILEKEGDRSSGMIMSYDLEPDQAARVEDIASNRRNTLMLLSGPALERWKLAAKEFNLRRISFKTVSSSYFGGSISCAGLLTVGDFQLALRAAGNLSEYGKILLPGIAFDSSGRDICGIHYLTLDTENIPLFLIS
jgi:NifB/MoaA-like Fe-S oxidoreductase